MAKFLTTSATNYILEELIKNARDRLILISPFLKLNDRISSAPGNQNNTFLHQSRRVPTIVHWDLVIGAFTPTASPSNPCLSPPKPTPLNPRPVPRSHQTSLRQLAQKLGIKTGELLDRHVTTGHLELRDGKRTRIQTGAARIFPPRVEPALCIAAGYTVTMVLSHF